MIDLSYFEPFAAAAPDVSTAENDDLILFASEPIAEPDETADVMGREEAVGIIRKITTKLSECRDDLLRLRDKQGWRSLGYQSFADCMRCEFGQHRITLWRQIQAAQVEKAISPHS